MKASINHKSAKEHGFVWAIRQNGAVWRWSATPRNDNLPAAEGVAATRAEAAARVIGVLTDSAPPRLTARPATGAVRWR